MSLNSDRTRYILRSLSKLSNKSFEHYALNRIYHRLDDPELEFVCQQCVRKSDQKYYLADLFLPQLGMYLEIDEGHHDSDQAKIEDAVRQLDITEATGLVEHRIAASNIKFEDFNKEIETFIEYVRLRKSQLIDNNTFLQWDYEGRFTSKLHLERGFIDIGPFSAFRTHRDALNCFGYNGGHHQSGSWKIPKHVCESIGLSGDCMVWFPKLYEQNDWDNSLSEDGCVIKEIRKDGTAGIDDDGRTRIAMARSTDKFNRTLYRFVGVFKADLNYRTGHKRRFNRIDNTIKVYK